MKKCAYILIEALILALLMIVAMILFYTFIAAIK